MSWLEGYKTYIIALGAVITAIGAYLNKSISLNELITALFAAFGAMSMRAGIKNDIKKG